MYGAVKVKFLKRLIVWKFWKENSTDLCWIHVKVNCTVLRASFGNLQQDWELYNNNHQLEDINYCHKALHLAVNLWNHFICTGINNQDVKRSVDSLHQCNTRHFDNYSSLLLFYNEIIMKFSQLTYGSII